MNGRLGEMIINKRRLTSHEVSGFFLSVPALLSMPFFLCGGLKIVYDLLLFREFRAVKPPEEGKG